jgi:oxalate decarboxylase
MAMARIVVIYNTASMQIGALSCQEVRGDVGTVPKAMAHFVTGDPTLRFLELFQAPRFMDVSLAQWMALTPHELVEAHLNMDRQWLDALRKDKQPIV